MTQAFISQFCARRTGVIVHVTSGATLVPMPLAIARVVSKQVAEPVWLARSSTVFCANGQMAASYHALVFQSFYLFPWKRAAKLNYDAH
jgi:hypothetical protein